MAIKKASILKENNNKDQSDNTGEKIITRQKFITTVGNTAIGVATLGGMGVTLDFLSPKVLLELPSRFNIGTLETILPNSVIFDENHRLFVFRDKQGYFFAVSAVCTHLGCNAQWKEDGIIGYPEGVIACPCHGSIFSKTGEVINGPAIHPLDRFRMFLEEDKITVDMEDKVSEEQMILKV